MVFKVNTDATLFHDQQAFRVGTQLLEIQVEGLLLQDHRGCSKMLMHIKLKFCGKGVIVLCSRAWPQINNPGR